MKYFEESLETAVILKEREIEGQKFYQNKLEIDLFKRYSKWGKWYIQSIRIENLQEKRYLGWTGTAFLNEKYEDEIIKAYKNELFNCMNMIRKMKQYDAHTRVEHYFIRVKDSKDNRELVFDSMIDAPRYWELTEEELETVIDNIKFEVKNGVEHDYEATGYIFKAEKPETIGDLEYRYLINGKLEKTYVDKVQKTVSTVIETEEDIAYNEYLEMWG